MHVVSIKTLPLIIIAIAFYVLLMVSDNKIEINIICNFKNEILIIEKKIILN